ERLYYVPVDARSGTGFDKLKERLGDSEHVRAFYLAVAPGIFGDFVDQIERHQLATPTSRIIVEKPVGRSLETAQEVNEIVGRGVAETNIVRIDHYIGKETVPNLMALRFANAMYAPLWNHAHIGHVQITVAESVGVEGRAAYYDTAGALRDMV